MRDLETVILTVGPQARPR